MTRRNVRVANAILEFISPIDLGFIIIKKQKKKKKSYDKLKMLCKPMITILQSSHFKDLVIDA